MNYKFLFAMTSSLLLCTSCLIKTRSDLQGQLNTTPEIKTPSSSSLKTSTQTSSQDSLGTWDRLNEIEQQLKELRSDIEILQNQLSQTHFQNKNKGSKSTSNKAYEEALFNFEKNLKNLNQRLQRLEGRKKSYKVKKTKTPSKLAKKPKKKTKTLTQTRKDKKQNPLKKRAEDAFKKKKWALSIELYQKLRLNSQGKVYREATYKIGEAFSYLGMKKEAQPFLEELIKKHPKTQEAEQAKVKLKQFYH